MTWEAVVRYARDGKCSRCKRPLARLSFICLEGVGFVCGRCLWAAAGVAVDL